MKLLSDQRGAIMLLGLFMAVLLAGSLYYVIGIAEAVRHREHMQDAADATAFGGAVLHARGMNLIVLINLIMAALLSVLVALKLIETALMIAIAALMVASIFAPAAAGAAVELNQVRSTVATMHDKLRPKIHSSLKALGATSRAVRAVIPWTTQVRLVERVRAEYAPRAQAGFAVPTRVQLPTEDGSFSELCERAGGMLGDTTDAVLGTVIPRAVSGVVGEAMEDLVGAGAFWFCDERASARPPKTKVREEHRLPILPAQKRCLDATPTEAADFENLGDRQLEEQARLCEEAARELASSAPDPLTGACLQDCGSDGLYALRTELAREQCQPATSRKLSGFQWQQRQLLLTFAREPEGLRLIDEELLYERLIGDDDPPCGSRKAPVDEAWNREPLGADGTPKPLCERVEKLPDTSAGEERRLVTRVDQIFGCIERREREIEVDTGDDADRSYRKSEKERNAMSPQRLAEGVELGDEDFQLRAVVFGQSPHAAPERALAAASWNPEARAQAREPSLQGRLALAQAEYYFELEKPDAPRADMMWKMRWRARLRRFRMPETGTNKEAEGPDKDGGVATTIASACDTLLPESFNCDGFDLDVSDLALH
ncbi:MAG: hypothetical protein OEZ06_02490 [Myxococcales bacterium]|nr:hypothetical protein [Myxococcales bacterium]